MLKRILLRISVSMVFMTVGIFTIVPVKGAEPELRINPNERFQAIDGFGASIAFMQGDVFMMKEPYRSKCMDLLFKDLGVTILRIRVDNKTESVKDEFTFNKDTAQVWTAQQALKRGIKTIVASSWSAPAWMKDNNTLMNGGHIKPEYYEDIAKWYSVYLKHYKEKLGIPIDYVCFDNEPDFAGTYDSMQATPEEFDKISRIIDQRLRADGIPTKLFGPETEGSALAIDEFAPVILKNPSPVRMFGVHLYADNNLPGLAQIAREYKIPVWVTEWGKLSKDKETGIDESLTIANFMNAALTVGNVNAFLYWNYWWDETAPQGLIVASGMDSYYEVTKRYYMFKQFARFIRPGAVRIGIDTGSTGLGASAYLNGDNLTVVLINKSDAAKTMNLSFPGDANLTIYETSGDKDCAKTGMVTIKDNQPAQIKIPANAIITLTGDFSKLE